VAPFDVLGPDPQLRWLREGSVNMLTLNLAQWRDVRVADYERTLDALRDLRLDDAARLGRDDARALARRVGAWTVVTGRVQGTGDSLFVVASLYDVASGRKLDEAQRGAPRAADPRPLFDLVARDLLDLAGAPPITVDLTRTTDGVAGRLPRLPRRRAGAQLVAAGAADSLFARAVEEDSTFALAWYKRALGRGWVQPRRRHAARLREPRPRPRRAPHAGAARAARRVHARSPAPSRRARAAGRRPWPRCSTAPAWRSPAWSPPTRSRPTAGTASATPGTTAPRPRAG
jgi:hypothetical protein